MNASNDILSSQAYLTSEKDTLQIGIIDLGPHGIGYGQVQGVGYRHEGIHIDQVRNGIIIQGKLKLGMLPEFSGNTQFDRIEFFRFEFMVRYYEIINTIRGA